MPFPGRRGKKYLELLKGLVTFMLQECTDGGRTSFTICVGCTGGRHRSVAVAEALGAYIFGLGYPTETLHRDINRS